MNKFLKQFALLIASTAYIVSAQAAVDSYRFAHVTISTPWYIFIFLLMGVFAPFVLMVILAWRNAARKGSSDMPDDTGGKPSFK